MSKVMEIVRNKMDKTPEETIVITALLKRFNEQRLPRALELKDKVFAGEKLNDSDLMFLETVFKDAQYILKYSDKFPEYQSIVSKGLQLYSDITQKALENEKKS
ncbi:MAG: hypothetical protein ACHQJ6_04350 [Candidatus Berkiellales bacterium]